MSDDHNVHDTLLDRISDAFDTQLEPIPTHLTAAARDAFSWRLADVELAELLFDSANDELVGVRGTTTERRSFRFSAGDFVIRVHLTSSSLFAMIEPPLSVECRVVTKQDTTQHRADEMGEFVVEATEQPVRLEVDLPSGTVVTPWIIG